MENGQVQGNASDLKNIETARNALARKQDSLSDGKIVSPIDGTITRVNINTGIFVAKRGFIGHCLGPHALLAVEK